LKKSLKVLSKFSKQEISLYGRIGLSFFLVIGFFITLVYNAFAPKSEIIITYKNYNLKNLSLPLVDANSIQEANIRKVEEEKRLEAIRIQLEARQSGINRIKTYLTKQKSPVANTEISELIYDLSKANGADYRIIIAIMGVESGFCNASFNHNCFGYLNGAKYPDYNAAFRDLVPKVSRQYAAKYGTDFVSLAKAYGIVNWQAGAEKLERYFNQI